MPDLNQLARVFESTGTDWAVAGGHAANVYRDEPRVTRDVDLMLMAAAVEMAAIASAFQERGWQVNHRPGDQWLVRLDHPLHGRVDLIAAETEYQRLAIQRARRSPLRDGGEAKVLCPEDVVILKLIADRYKDNDDVASILVGGTALDSQYLHKWLVAWELTDRYQTIRDRALGKQGTDSS